MRDMLQVTLVRPRQLAVGRAEIPSPGPGEVLLRVEKVGVCGSDLTIYRGLHPYVSYPLVMGHEFAGTVTALGPGATGPSPGTRVAVIPHLVCGRCEACLAEKYNFCEELRCTGAEADGAHAEYKVMPVEMVMPIPESMSMDQAALVEPAAVAYHAAGRGEIRPGDKVLIIGAGPIGVFCAQACKALGAGSVILADLDPWRLQIAAGLGVDGLVDVGHEDLGRGLLRLAGGNKAIDLFFDCVGERGRVLNDIIGLARRGARVVAVGVLQKEYDVPLLPDFVQHELKLSGTTMYTPRDYRDVIELMSRGTVRTDGMITHYFPLDRAAEVFAMMDQKRERYFKIVFNVGA